MLRAAVACGILDYDGLLHVQPTLFNGNKNLTSYERGKIISLQYNMPALSFHHDWRRRGTLGLQPQHPALERIRSYLGVLPCAIIQVMFTGGFRYMIARDANEQVLWYQHLVIASPLSIRQHATPSLPPRPDSAATAKFLPIAAKTPGCTHPTPTPI